MTLHFIKDNPLCMLFNLDDWKKEDDDDEEDTYSKEDEMLIG